MTVAIIVWLSQESFLEKQKVDVESVLDWIINEGGGCDCEVLYNVEERFEEYR